MMNPLELVVHYKLVWDQAQVRQTVSSVTHLSANIGLIVKRQVFFTIVPSLLMNNGPEILEHSSRHYVKIMLKIGTDKRCGQYSDNIISRDIDSHSSSYFHHICSNCEVVSP